MLNVLPPTEANRSNGSWRPSRRTEGVIDARRYYTDCRDEAVQTAAYIWRAYASAAAAGIPLRWLDPLAEVRAPAYPVPGTRWQIDIQRWHVPRRPTRSDS